MVGRRGESGGRRCPAPAVIPDFQQVARQERAGRPLAR